MSRFISTVATTDPNTIFKLYLLFKWAKQAVVTIEITLSNLFMSILFYLLL